MAKITGPRKKEKLITAERPASILLTEKQNALVDATMLGKSPREAATAAGYAHPSKDGDRALKSEEVIRALAEARSELSSATQITRADVIEGFMEAINIARLSADPASMIKGWSETAKVLGLYAPEVKKIEMSSNQKRLQSKYEAMTDEELIRIIEGEARDVTHEQ